LKGEAIHCLRDPGRRPFVIQGRGLFASFKGGDSLSFIEGGGCPSFKGRDCFCHLREGTVCRSSREAIHCREGTVCHSREGTVRREKRLFVICQGREESMGGGRLSTHKSDVVGSKNNGFPCWEIQNST